MAGFPPNMPPPGGAPQQPQNPAQNPLAQLASKPQQGGAGQSGSLLQLILAFLAGSGFGPFSDNLGKLMGTKGRGMKGGDVNRPHQPSPNQPQPPQQAGQPNPAQISPQMIQQLLSMLAQKGQPPQSM